MLQAALSPVGGPSVDVSGGWFDAGDYIKFVQTSSYVVAVMLVAARDHAGALGPGGSADFYGEAAFGLDWLSRMWNDQTRALLYQVGIGDGSAKLKIAGDHDLWRLPEADDALSVTPGSRDYFVKYRPAFQAGPAGSKISPNLAGRLAADFGLCSQVMRGKDAALADRCLLAGEHVLALADPAPTPPLLTTAPHDYYPESAWQDDLELGATEMSSALAAAGTLPPGLPVTDPKVYLGQAASWAKAYLSSRFDGGDSLNLYDVSALAHRELVGAITGQGSPPGLAVTTAQLVGNLRAQLAAGAKQGQSDPFDLGVVYGKNGPDLVPHALGLALTAQWLEDLAADGRYAAFGTAQRDFVLGANAWGKLVRHRSGPGVPALSQHRIANLAGHLDGTPPVLLGAVGDGPSESGQPQGSGSAGRNRGSARRPAATSSRRSMATARRTRTTWSTGPPSSRPTTTRY